MSKTASLKYVRDISGTRYRMKGCGYYMIKCIECEDEKWAKSTKYEAKWSIKISIDSFFAQ